MVIVLLAVVFMEIHGGRRFVGRGGGDDTVG